MNRICAWCNKALDTIDVDSTEITHGICDDCREEVRKEIQARKESKL